MKKAVAFKTLNKRNQNRLVLRSGAKGTGKILWSCIYWSFSQDSRIEALSSLHDYAKKHSLEVEYEWLNRGEWL